MKRTILFLTILFLQGCTTHLTQSQQVIDGYIPLSQLTKDTHLVKKYDGKKVKVWGYPQYDTISTCGMANWYFSIQTDTYDSDTIHINTPASYDFAELYSDLRDKNNRQKNTKIFAIGTLHTFSNASNFSTLIDFDIDVSSANNIKLK